MICLETVKRYCKNYTEIENYQEAISDKSELWVCHHRMEEVFTHKELKNAGWYYNRPASELIFIRESEHNGNAKLHIGLKRKNANMIGKPSNRPKRYIRCVETGEVHCCTDWYKLGYTGAYLVASGINKSSQSFHFEFVPCPFQFSSEERL